MCSLAGQMETRMLLELSHVSSNTNLTANFTAIPDPPTASTLSFPEDDKVCQEGTSVSDTESSVNFQWSASENTTSYDLIYQ